MQWFCISLIILLLIGKCKIVECCLVPTFSSCVIVNHSSWMLVHFVKNILLISKFWYWNQFRAWLESRLWNFSKICHRVLPKKESHNDLCIFFVLFFSLQQVRQWDYGRGEFKVLPSDIIESQDSCNSLYIFLDTASVICSEKSNLLSLFMYSKQSNAAFL